MRTSFFVFQSFAIVASLLLSGCASVTNTETQQISIATRDKGGVAVSAADCLWKNTKGEGRFQSPSVVSVRRDYAALHIICKKEGFPDAVDAFNSKSTSAMAGNILVGGLIGAAIDHSSGAAYDYPATMTVWFAAQSKVGPTPPHATSGSSSQLAPRTFLASGFANIDDVDAIPFIGDKGRERYRDWLTRSTPRAFAISTTGAYSSSFGLKPPDERLPTDPSERALQTCSKVSKVPCRLYAVNGAVVWVKEAAATPVSSTVSTAPVTP